MNAVVFGIGAAVTIRVLGLILDPSSRLPLWLALVLLPLFSFVMWVALRPFRRLTHMISPHADPFNDAAGAFGDTSRKGKRWAKKAITAAGASYAGNLAAAATASAAEPSSQDDVPDRAEARTPATAAVTTGHAAPTPGAPPPALPAAPAPHSPPAGDAPAPTPSPGTPPGPSVPQDDPLDYVPTPPVEEVPLPPTEPEWVDGEEVFAIYRPGDAQSDDAA